MAMEHSFKLREKTLNANRFLELNNYSVFQKNGQRVSTHKTLRIDSKTKARLEVFVGKLPRDLFEDELLPAMEKAGKVQNIRLMMDFSGSNRGFAFVRYTTPEDASLACRILNGTKIRYDHPEIGVLISFDNRKLYLGDLPYNLDEARLRRQLDETVNGVEQVIVPDIASGVDKRHAFVIFETHEAATQARRILCPGNTMICGRHITVDWGKPDMPFKSPSNKSRDRTSSSCSHNLSIQPTNGIITIERAPLEALMPADINFEQPEPNILGEKAKQMLAACPDDPDCTLTLTNINTRLVESNMEAVKLIFALGNKLPIVDLRITGRDTMKIIYQEAKSNLFMSNVLNLWPEKFKKLAAH